MKQVLMAFYIISLFCIVLYVFIKIGDELEANEYLTWLSFLLYGAGLYYVIKDDK